MNFYRRFILYYNWTNNTELLSNQEDNNEKIILTLEE